MQNYNYPYNQYAFVNGIEGAKAYQVMPSQTIMLMDSDRPIVFMKTSDNLGKASLRYFNLVEMSEEEAAKAYLPKPAPEYALKDDFEALNKRIDNLIELMEKKENKGD